MRWLCLQAFLRFWGGAGGRFVLVVESEGLFELALFAEAVFLVLLALLWDDSELMFQTGCSASFMKTGMSLLWLSLLDNFG